MSKNIFTVEEVSKLLSHAILAPLAFSISPPRGGIVFSYEQWHIAKSTVRALEEYFSVSDDILESDTVFIRATKTGETYTLHTLKNANLEGLFSNASELFEQLCTVISPALEQHINSGKLDNYFSSLFSQEE